MKARSFLARKSKVRKESIHCGGLSGSFLQGCRIVTSKSYDTVFAGEAEKMLVASIVSLSMIMS